MHVIGIIIFVLLFIFYFDIIITSLAISLPICIIVLGIHHLYNRSKEKKMAYRNIDDKQEKNVVHLSKYINLISYHKFYNLAKIKLNKKYNYVLNKNQKLQSKKQIDYNSIEYIDILTGIEFEKYMSKLLANLGFINVKRTPDSNDYGIDIITEKDSVKFAIQCKHYKSKVSNSSVQEANSGKQYYNCHVGVVVTNNYFTSNAIELAKSNGIILWDRKKLIEMLKDV